jgi:NADH:ubiquinone oxidoreductase subunit C
LKYKSSKTRKIEKLKEENEALSKYIRENNVRKLATQIEDTLIAKEEYEELLDECKQLKADYEHMINELQIDINEYHKQMNQEIDKN